MGKLSNMMYMIDLLNTGNIYTIKELSEKIGVAIESFKGPNGGYFMIDKIKNYTNINKHDINFLNFICIHSNLYKLTIVSINASISVLSLTCSSILFFCALLSILY